MHSRQLVERRERPRIPGALRHPGRMLEHPADSFDELHPWSRVFSCSGFIIPESPSTRTSRMHSGPASVNSAASTRAGSSNAFRTPSSGLPEAGLQINRSAALPVPKSPVSSSSAKRLGARARRQIQHLRGAQRHRFAAPRRCMQVGLQSFFHHAEARAAAHIGAQRKPHAARRDAAAWERCRCPARRCCTGNARSKPRTPPAASIRSRVA